MRRLARAIATAGGIGYLPKAPGTAGSLVGLLLGWIWPWSGFSVGNAIAIAAAIIVGVIASSVAERDLRQHDPPCVVIDEVVGMWIVMLLRPFATYPPTNTHLSPREILYHVVVPLMAFALFRWFDITKPPPLKRLARFPQGWGIMADDLGASMYAGFILWAICLIFVRCFQGLYWWLLHQ